MYQNDDHDAISCSRAGINELKELRSAGDSRTPSQCKRGGFSNFILFEKVAKSDEYIYIRAFVSSYRGEEWREAYLEVKAGTQLKSCRDGVGQLSTLDCENNLELYEEYKGKIVIGGILSDGSTFKSRAPDSIKQEKVVE